MPRHYPTELRRQTCERMLAGEAVKDLSAELGIHNVNRPGFPGGSKPWKGWSHGSKESVHKAVPA